MAGRVNTVIIVGNLGADPEFRDRSNRQRVANLRVARGVQSTDRSRGEKRQRTEWNPIDAFDQNAAQYARNYLRKGKKFYIERQMEIHKWQVQSGENRYSVVILVNQVSGKLIDLSSKQETWEAANHEPTRSTLTQSIDDVIPVSLIGFERG